MGKTEDEELYRRAMGWQWRRSWADQQRGSGRSTRAIELLPPLPVYVTFGRSDHHYEISRRLGRNDISFVAHDHFAEWVHRERGGRVFSTVYFDHAVQEKTGPSEWEMLMNWLDAMKPYLTRYPDDEV
jgi:hypothetical protein